MSDKYFNKPDNMPVDGKASVKDAKGEKNFSEPGKSSGRYDNRDYNSCDDMPKDGDSDGILDPSKK